MLRGPGAPGALPDEWGVPVREMPTDFPYYFDCLNKFVNVHSIRDDTKWFLIGIIHAIRSV